MIMTVRDEDKDEAVEIGKRFERSDTRFLRQKGTAEALYRSRCESNCSQQD